MSFLRTLLSQKVVSKVVSALDALGKERGLRLVDCANETLLQKKGNVRYVLTVPLPYIKIHHAVKRFCVRLEKIVQHGVHSKPV